MKTKFSSRHANDFEAFSKKFCIRAKILKVNRISIVKPHAVRHLCDKLTKKR